VFDSSNDVCGTACGDSGWVISKVYEFAGYKPLYVNTRMMCSCCFFLHVMPGMYCDTLRIVG
jgi:hypothetical protein